jgi:hypothetical protein
MGSTRSAWARISRPFVADAPRAGWGALLLLSPHLLLGTWLLLVPDHLAFLTNQLVALLHVGLALASLPLVGWWIWRHGRRMQAPRARKTGSALVSRWVLTAAVAVASLTGFFVIWAGDILAPSSLHAACGVAVAVPLAWHLWLGAHRRAASGVLLLLVLSTAGASVAKRLLPPEPVDAVIPAFAYATRPTALYEEAESCAGCHREDYDDWKRSTHARTLSNPNVRDGAVRLQKSLGFDLADFGKIVGGAKPENYDQAIFSCEACHSPTSFYGDDPTPMLEAKGVSSEGVTCTFCHTLREVKGAEGVALKTTQVREMGTADFPKMLPQLPAFVSAPETVRRYLGQGSRSPVARMIAGWLIRWRPAVHSRDYHSPVLDSSRSCMACHGMGGFDAGPEIPHKTYISWQESGFNTGDPKTTVTCQDCHMVGQMTGKPVDEPGRSVEWGPVRPKKRSHLLLGGNVSAARQLNDPGYTLLEHEMNKLAAKLTINEMATKDGTLSVAVAVHSELVGHYLPAMETHARYLWVQIRAVDAAGATIASSPPPKSPEDFDGPSPVMFRCTEQPKVECDTLLKPQSTRVFTARLELPADAKPARIEAELHVSIDDQPIATTSKPFSI